MKYKIKIHKLGLICILIIFNSCDNSLDRKDFNSINETILNSSVNNDTLSIKDLYINNEKNGFIKDIPQKIKPLIGKDIKILKSDTSTEELLQHKIKAINTFFKSDTNYYSLESYYTRDKEDNIYVKDIWITNLSEKCNEWYSEPYNPEGKVTFKSLGWSNDHSNKSFKSGRIKIQNDLDFDIDFIKFRLILYNPNNEIFFNKTIQSDSKIYSGDLSVIEIPEMSGLFAGFEIIPGNLDHKSQLIEILPKPESFYCKTITELKSLK